MVSGLSVAPLPLLAENGFSYALKESSWPGIVVCVILVILSCFSWAVMVTKMRMVSRAKRETGPFLEAYRDSQDPLALFREGTHHKGTPLFMAYQDGAAEMNYQLSGEKQKPDEEPPSVAAGSRVVPTQMETVSQCIDRAIGESAVKLEGQMSILATAVSGAPFLGLLGTVWGVMDTFSGVASAGGAASLKTMAPGVSAALVTTVVALLVAIPAMFGYNFIVTSIKQLIAQLETFASELRADFDRAFLEHAPLAAQILPAPVAVARRAVKPAFIAPEEDSLETAEADSPTETEAPTITARDLLRGEKPKEEAEEAESPTPTAEDQPRRITRRRDPNGDDFTGELPLSMDDPDGLES